MPFNISSIKISSDGIWQGENPLHYAFPLLIIQTTLVIFVSRLIALLLKPFHQPLVVAEILGGIVLGPSALGRNKNFMGSVFPSWSTPILESVGSMGLLYFLFLMGLELDLRPIKRSGRKAFGIAVAGISLPFALGIGVAFLYQKVQISGSGFAPESVAGFLFVGVALSITAFPVLARILAELKLLTTDVGETAMAAAALNDVVAWVLLALSVAVASGSKSTAVTSIWILLSGLGFVAFMLVVVRPGVHFLARKCSRGSNASEGFCIILLAGVMVFGLATDLIGIHAIFGAFVFGVVIPKRGEFTGKLMNTIEVFVTGLLLPLYFASTGLKTDISEIRDGETWGLVVLVIVVACAGKILGTFAMAVMCRVPVRESVVLGVLMNTKGLVELIVLNIGREKKVLSDQMFTILVMMALFTTFMTTPIVTLVYRQQSNKSSSSNPKDGDTNNNLRILACIRGHDEFHSLMPLIDLHKPTQSHTTKVYAMHLVELTDRSSSILMAKRTRNNGFPCTGRSRQVNFDEQLAAALRSYHRRGGQGQQLLQLRLTTSVSILSEMDGDICHVAEKKRASMIILHFHKQWRRLQEEDGGGGDEGIEIIDLGQGWREVNENVLRNAPCSVAVLVDCGSKLNLQDSDAGHVKRVCIVFLGGPDSCEALQFGDRIAHHPGMRITVVRFSSSTAQISQDQEEDEAILGEFLERRSSNGIVELVEKETGDIVKDVLAIAQSNEFEVMVVGRGRYGAGIELGDQFGEHHNNEHEEELGAIGGVLASQQHGIINGCCVVVIQKQPDPAYCSALIPKSSPKSSSVRGKEAFANDCIVDLE